MPCCVTGEWPEVYDAGDAPDEYETELEEGGVKAGVPEVSD